MVQVADINEDGRFSLILWNFLLDTKDQYFLARRLSIRNESISSPIAKTNNSDIRFCC